MKKTSLLLSLIILIILSSASVKGQTIPITSNETIFNFDFQFLEPRPPYTSVGFSCIFDPSDPVSWGDVIYLNLYGGLGGTELLWSTDITDWIYEGTSFAIQTANPYYDPMCDGAYSVGLRMVSGTAKLTSCTGCGYGNEVGPCLTYPITLSLLTPNGGERYLAGKSIEIKYPLYGDSSVPLVNIIYSADKGLSWIPIASNVLNTGSYEWTAPDIDSENCIVRVSSTDNPAIVDASDSPFMIYRCLENNPADINNDCYINLQDLALLAQNWLWCRDKFNPDCNVN